MSQSFTLTAHQADPSVVLPNVLNVAPKGTKITVLNLGSLEADLGWMIRGANTSLASNPDGPPKNARRELACYSILIDHPTEGLILWETGCGRDFATTWGPVADVFAPCKSEEKFELDTAIKAAGYDIKDVKKVLMGHLHLDHAGGLPYFKNTQTEIWVHKLELESAYYSCATKADAAVYQPHYLDLSLNLNWKTFDDRSIDFAPGLVLQHLPGHTAGLCGLQVNLQDSGTFFFLSDHAHVWENYADDVPQGWLARDHPAWFNSNQRLKRLARATNGQVFPGHDLDRIAPLLGKSFT
ncbi:unnamed protein product [Sympodiomycopsis kandeliae]